MNGCVAALLMQMITCAISSSPSGGGADTELARDPVVLRHFWSLVQDARYGYSEQEDAAFVVRSEAGEVALVRWPRSERKHHGSWRGAFPRGTVAIVHTHPNWIPHPSRIDTATAQKKRVPIYVLTRNHITRTDGADVRTVIAGDWRPR